MRHRVQQGECVASIAHQHGFFWNTLWSHPENRALAEARPDPNCLLPGDEIFIPEKRLKLHGAATGARHRFRLRTTPVRFKLQLLRDGEPRANLPYTLEIDGAPHEGTTDAEGRLEHWVPAGAHRGRLLIEEDEYDVLFRHLDPIETPTGLQQRLANIGLYDGPIDGVIGPEVKSAIALFQVESDLPRTGEPDQPTLDALERRHADE